MGGRRDPHRSLFWAGNQPWTERSDFNTCIFSEATLVMGTVGVVLAASPLGAASSQFPAAGEAPEPPPGGGRRRMGQCWWDQREAEQSPRAIPSPLAPSCRAGAGTGTGSWAESNSWQSRAAGR